MKDIIIVGTGKAGFLHFFSYKKFKEIGKIYFVDNYGKMKNENIENKKVYLKVEDVIKENKIDVNNIIVDICTPKSVFREIIEQCQDIGINNIIVEKPFIVEDDFLENNPDLNIAMVHNYNYSKIIKSMKKIIVEKKLKPKLIYTNFSKNRTEESFSGRGMYKKVTRNTEHDIPHQVYMAQFILDKTKETKLLLEEEKDMVKGNERLKKHGYSKIIAKKDDIIVIHESDFSTNTKIREVIVVCDDDIVIKGEFLFYDNNLNKLENGYVTVLKNNTVEYKETIDFDDNMYECLIDIYNYFNKGQMNEIYRNEISEFSNEMNIYMKA